jgi:hypothetical protein
VNFPYNHPRRHMALAHQPRANDSDDLPKEFVELGNRIAALPEPYSSQLETAYQQAIDAVGRRRRILTLVQEALSQLRLDVKYLMFDLEVTRRERDALQAQLGEGEKGW